MTKCNEINQFAKALESIEIELVDLPVSSEEFWQGIEERLDEVVDESVEEQRRIERYFDNELTDFERRWVERARRRRDLRRNGTIHVTDLVEKVLELDREPVLKLAKQVEW